MDKMTVEMVPVRKCSVEACGYNVGKSCHAKAITVGDTVNPECDTYFVSPAHSRETRRVAGVGACKVSACRYNDDYECTAQSIEVGVAKDQVKCLTYWPRGT